MAYFELKKSPYSDVGVRNEPVLPHYVSFLEGHLIPPEAIPGVLKFDLKLPQDEEMPHIFMGSIALFSGQFIESLRRAGVDNFQAFPAVLTDPKTGHTWDNYFAFNVVGVIDGVDMDKSDYAEIMGDGGGEMPPLVEFRDIVLSRAKLGDHKMFRLIQSPDVLVIREDVVETLEEDEPEDGWDVEFHELEVV